MRLAKKIDSIKSLEFRWSDITYLTSLEFFVILGHPLMLLSSQTRIEWTMRLSQNWRVETDELLQIPELFTARVLFCTLFVNVQPLTFVSLVLLLNSTVLHFGLELRLLFKRSILILLIILFGFLVCKKCLLEVGSIFRQLLVILICRLLLLHHGFLEWDWVVVGVQKVRIVFRVTFERSSLILIGMILAFNALTRNSLSRLLLYLPDRLIIAVLMILLKNGNCIICCISLSISSWIAPFHILILIALHDVFITGSSGNQLLREKQLFDLLRDHAWRCQSFIQVLDRTS